MVRNPRLSSTFGAPTFKSSAEIGNIARELREDYPAVDVTTVVFGKEFAGVGCCVIPQDRVLAVIAEIERLTEKGKLQGQEISITRERNEALERALQFIADGYDNHDINHVDFRVKAYQVALDVLGRMGRAPE